MSDTFDVNTGHKLTSGCTVKPSRRKPIEVWMQVKSPDLIKVLMKDQKISGRHLSESVGWNSHTYLQRILRGEIRTVTTDKAEKIAICLGVPRDVLFVPKVSSNDEQSVQDERRQSA